MFLRHNHGYCEASTSQSDSDASLKSQCPDSNSFGPLIKELGVLVLGARWADAVSEMGAGMFADVMLELIPIAFVVADFFAVGTNREKTAQHLHLAQKLLQLNHH